MKGTPQEVSVCDLTTIHPAANVHPMMNDIEFTALCEDIKLSGQREPIVLYRGTVIDGRNRLKAHKILEMPTINVVSLSYHATSEEVSMYVDSSEVRRHQTKTQLSIKAWRMTQTSAKKLSLSAAAAKVGVGVAGVKRVGSLAKLGRLDIIDLLFNGNRYKLSTNRYTDALQPIIDDIKAEKARAESVTAFHNTVEVEDITPERQAHLAQVKAIRAFLNSMPREAVDDALCALDL